MPPDASIDRYPPHEPAARARARERAPRREQRASAAAESSCCAAGRPASRRLGSELRPAEPRTERCRRARSSRPPRRRAQVAAHPHRQSCASAVPGAPRRRPVAEAPQRRVARANHARVARVGAHGHEAGGRSPSSAPIARASGTASAGATPCLVGSPETLTCTYTSMPGDRAARRCASSSEATDSMHEAQRTAALTLLDCNGPMRCVVTPRPAGPAPWRRAPAPGSPRRAPAARCRLGLQRCTDHVRVLRLGRQQESHGPRGPAGGALGCGDPGAQAGEPVGHRGGVDGHGPHPIRRNGCTLDL